MVTQFRNEISACIPSIRIEAYRLAQQTDLEMLTNYFWNIELSKSLHTTMHALEIAFRNVFNEAMTSRHNPYWFDHLNALGVLGPRQIRQLKTVRQRLTDFRKAHTPDNIVAELMLGFWADLASSRYEQAVWRPNRFELVRLLFPHGPTKLSHGLVGRRLSMANTLRNRMFHHEPIFADQRLGIKHQEINDLVRWINPRLQGYVASVDTFPTVFQTGRTIVEQSILDFV